MSAEPGAGPWEEAAGLADALKDIVDGMPGDELTPGYRISEETRAAFERAIPLLEQAYEIVEAVRDREERRYAEYCERFDGPKRPSLRLM